MEREELAKEFVDFLYETPTPYNYCQYARPIMEAAGYVELKESEKWEEIPDKFFVIRRDRAFCAVNKADLSCGVILGSHSDSSTLKITKEITNEGYQQLEVSAYDGGLWYGWIDRDLRIAGKVFFMQDGKLKSKIINAKDPFAFIPGVAVHLAKDHGCNPQYNFDCFRPVLGKAGTEKLIPKLASYIGCNPEDIVDYDLSLHPVQKGTVVGVDNEFISAPKIDDSVSVFAVMNAFIGIDKPAKGLLMHVVFDNEEIGSGTDCGAKSNFIRSILSRIGVKQEFYERSCMGSVDVCHATHPNKTELGDPGGFLSLGDGVGYGWSARQSMIGDRPNIDILRDIADRVGVSLTAAVEKNSLCAGSTISPHLTSQLGIRVMDFSVPVLAMHGIMETAALSDIADLIKLLTGLMKHYFEYE